MTTQTEQDKRAKQDAFHNRLTGVGGNNDPRNIFTFRPGKQLRRTELSNMYRHNWPSRRTIDILAGDSVRKWVSFEDMEPDTRAALTGMIDRTGVESVVLKAITLARLFGGSIIYLGILSGQSSLEAPLNEDKIRGIPFMNVFDRYQVEIIKWYDDPLKAKFGEPEIYEIRPHALRGNTGSRVIKIHETRVIRFDGEDLPDIDKRGNSGWGDSVLTSSHEALKDFSVSSQSGAALTQDFVTKVLTIPNLADILLKPGGEAQLSQRIQFAGAKSSNLSTSLIGEGEELRKIQTPINGLTDLMGTFETYLCSSNGIPKSRFFGKELGKLSGATETTREYYESIEAYQKRKLRMPLERLFTLMLKSLGGEPDKWSFIFNPLSSMTDAETVDMRFKQSQTDTNNIASGMVLNSEAAKSRYTDKGYSIETTVNHSVKRPEPQQAVGEGPTKPVAKSTKPTE